MAWSHDPMLTCLGQFISGSTEPQDIRIPRKKKKKKNPITGLLFFILFAAVAAHAVELVMADMKPPHCMVPRQISGKDKLILLLRE